MTDADIYRFLVTVLEHAESSGNVAETCRLVKVSRKSFYRWRKRAERSGLEALMPKARRASQMPNATPPTSSSIWRPAFHRRPFTSIRQLQAEADACRITYTPRRRNHGDFMADQHPRPGARQPPLDARPSSNGQKQPALGSSSPGCVPASPRR